MLFRSASRKSMAIGGGKRKWRNARGFIGSLAAAAGVEISVYHREMRGACAGVTTRENVIHRTLAVALVKKARYC